MLTRTRIWLLAAVGVFAVGGSVLGVGALPLVAGSALAVAVILLTPRRVPVRDRPFAEFDDGKDLTRFGWGHPMATSMMMGAAAFAWLNGTSHADAGGPGGLGGADGLGGGADFGGGFDAGGGGGGSE